MIIKKIKKKDINTNKSYFTFQLFEEIEVKGLRKLKMILSLGSKLNIAQEKHQELADCIECKARKNKSLKEFDKEVEILAEEFVKQLLARENARNKKPIKPLKKPSSLKKKHSFDFSHEDNDFKSINKFSKFKNKSIKTELVLNKKTNQPLLLKKASEDKFSKKEPFNPVRKFSKFQDKSRSESDRFSDKKSNRSSLVRKKRQEDDFKKDNLKSGRKFSKPKHSRTNKIKSKKTFNRGFKKRFD